MCGRASVFFLTRLRVLRMRVFCVYFGSLISELHCIFQSLTSAHLENWKNTIITVTTQYSVVMTFYFPLRFVQPAFQPF